MYIKEAPLPNIYSMRKLQSESLSRMDFSCPFYWKLSKFSSVNCMNSTTNVWVRTFHICHRSKCIKNTKAFPEILFIVVLGNRMYKFTTWTLTLPNVKSFTDKILYFLYGVSFFFIFQNFQETLHLNNLFIAVSKH